MKRLSLYLFLILFSLQTPSQADDIRDFQIEGMSLGDSALDYFSEEEIQKNKQNYFKNKKYTPVQNDLFPFFKTYNAVDFAFKTNDKKYIIQSIAGILFYDKNVKDCYKKMDEIITEMDKLFPNQKKHPKKTYKHGNKKKNKSGKSIITDVEYEFKNGDSVIVACYDYSIEHGSQDHLSVAIDKKAYADFLRDEAY